MTCRTHDRFYLLRCHLLVKHLQELIKHLVVSFWKEFLGVWCQIVDIGGLAAAPTHTALLD
jgi:hypothetical protein